MQKMQEKQEKQEDKKEEQLLKDNNCSFGRINSLT
jgi:hypothetical protein